MIELKKKLKLFLDSSDYEYALIVKNVQDKTTISINQDTRFHAASIIKLYYLYEAIHQVSKGILNLDQIFKLPDNEKVDGSGVLKLLHNDTPLTLLDIITLMIVVSDNTATNMLFDILGKDNINSSLHQLNINNTYIARKLMRVIPGVYSYTTAKDTCHILETFLNSTVLNKELMDVAMSILHKQQHNEYLSKDLVTCGICNTLISSKLTCHKCGTSVDEIDSYKIPFAHKTGEINGIVHDAGIMTINNQKYIIVMLTKELTDNNIAIKSMNYVGKLIYDYFSNKPTTL